MLKSVLKYCCLALAACLGSFAYASTDELPDVITALAYISDHGAAGAKLQAELNHMADSGDTRMCSSTGALMKDSHGYLQASASEVTKGTTGVGAGLYLS